MRGWANYEKLTDHIVILGWHGSRTMRMVDHIRGGQGDREREIVLCSAKRIENPMPDQVRFVTGTALNTQDLLHRAAVANANFIIALGHDDNETLAAALGASVHRNEIGPEIGWHDVLLSELAAADSVWSTVHAEQQGQFSAFHSHGDVFDVPDGAVPLAHSEKTACQAFVYGRAIYGTLFHMEIDEHQIREMADLFAADVVATQQTSASLLKDATTRLPTVNGLGRVVFSNWLSLVLAASERRAP